MNYKIPCKNEYCEWNKRSLGRKLLLINYKLRVSPTARCLKIDCQLAYTCGAMIAMTERLPPPCKFRKLRAYEK